MRAITYTEFGPASDVLGLDTLPTPDPSAGEVLVRLQVSGVNPSDVKARAGGRPGVTEPPFPVIVPHSDGAGVIEAVGDGVDPARVGERVWIWNGQWRRAFGTAADHIALPSEQAVALPDAASFEEGAILGIPGLTATHAVLGGGPVEGQALLISGGAGTVGRLAIQVAKASGAQVMATARGTQGRQAAQEAGADHVFDYSDPDLAEQILETTGGQPLERIIEVEFGKNVETNTKLIAECGTIVSFGSAKDMTPTLPFYPLMFKAVHIELVLIYLLRQRERHSAIANLTRLLEQGALRFQIGRVMDLADCALAHDIVASGDRDGPVLLKLT
ncbi:MAG: NADPH:quinone reductase [Pseudomonadota bacterium]